MDHPAARRLALGTRARGLLNPAEAELVATRLCSTELNSGYGLRTMSSGDGGYSPLSYHCGSVWPHDTAIVVSGLVREGLAGHAAPLVDGLLRASAGFAGRFPELWAGDQRGAVRGPAPYPAACRPQAWAAAAAVSMLTDLVGLAADVPAGLLLLSRWPRCPLVPYGSAASRLDAVCSTWTSTARESYSTRAPPAACASWSPAGVADSPRTRRQRLPGDGLPVGPDKVTIDGSRVS